MLAKSSVLWFLGGLLAGAGYIFGVFYLMITKKDPSRWLGLMLFLGPFGSIMLYFLCRKEHKDIATLSMYLFYGFLVWIPIALLLGINPLYQLFGYVHGWLGS